MTFMLASDVRTTIEIEDVILRELRQILKREGGTLGGLVSRLLTQALARTETSPTPFRWTAKPLRARIDLADKEALYNTLDEPDRAAEP
jgi:hypothetical protein